MTELVKTHRRPGNPLIWHALMMDIHKEATEALAQYAPTMQAYERVGLRPEVIARSDDLVIPIYRLPQRRTHPSDYRAVFDHSWPQVEH